MPLYGADLGVTGLTVEVTEIADDKTDAVIATVTGITERGSTGFYYRNWTLDPSTAMLYWQKQSDATIFALGAANERDIDAILVDTGTTIPGTITTAQNDLDTITGTAGVLIGTDAANVTEISDAVWDEAVSGHVIAGSFGATDAAVLADTNELQGDWTNAGRLDTILDELTVNVDAIEADTQDIQTQVGTAGAGLTNINLPNQTMDITGSLSGSVGSVTGAVGSVTGAVGSVTGNVGGSVADLLAISGSTAAADNLEASAETIIVDTVGASFSETTTAFQGGGTATLSAVDDFYNGRIVIFTSGALQNQASDITDYTGATKVFTVTALTSAASDGDSFVVV